MPPRKHKNKKKNHQHQNQQQHQHQQHQHQAQKSSTPSEGNDTPSPEYRSTPTLDPRLPYRLEISNVYGRYYVANRDLKPGEVFIRERPLVIGPCVSVDPVCLGCYVPVELKASQYRCPACRWPICGPACRGMHQRIGHSDHECDLLKTQKSLGESLTSKASPNDIKNLYELILIVRILLLKQHDPERFETVLQMESHTELRKQNVELWQHYQQNVVDRLLNDWHLPNFEDIEIHTICGIIDVNCFEIGHHPVKARCLYPSAFLLAHDCSPNTSHTDDPHTHEIVLRTSRRIRKNESITLSYAYTLQGTLKRRDFMHAGKLFWCSCQRCKDPTELGTDCSAIVCSKCGEGSVRSTDPLNQQADWKCDKCAFKLTSEQIVNLLDKIYNDLESIDAHDVAGLENFLKRYRDVLRPSHYLLLSAKYSLCQVYGRAEGCLLHHMTLEDLKRKERYCREFLAVIDVLEPGLTRLRGLIMYELHAPIMMIAQHLMQANLINRKDFQKSIKEVFKLLQESCDILKMEPVGSSEHAMGLAAEEALSKMS